MRSLLLEALRTWRIRRFDCHAIKEALAYIEQKIERFEERVGEIRAAAAGKAWLSIKQAVYDMMHQVASQACMGKRADTSARHENERQSGIVGISWDRHCQRWQLSWKDTKTGKQEHSYFPIRKFLKQGREEQTAVEAALEEAKARQRKLALEGRLAPPKPTAAESLVRGVDFVSRDGKWRVRMTHPVSKKRVYMQFDFQEEAEAKARKIAKKFGLRSEKPRRVHI